MTTTDKLIISAYGSHNAAISMYYKGVYTVVEVERWLNSKNAGLTSYLPSKHMQLIFDEICNYLISQTDKTVVDVYISGYMGKVKPKFEYTQHIPCDHHTAHAAGAFYQSPYEKSLVFTFDGGGDAGFFNVYLCDRLTGINLIKKFDQDLGFPYMVLADYLSDIKKEALTIGNLVYAGKLMGLCSYGKVREDWLPHFDAFYDKFNYVGNSYLGGAETRHEALTTLFRAIGVEDFDLQKSRFSDQFAWDIAATTQQAFENQFFKHARPFLDKYPDLPVSLSGGCALNVLLNSKLLAERKGAVSVPPNTNDCGISVGGLLWYLAPNEQVDLTYSGLPVMDDNRLAEFMEDGRFTMIENFTAKDIARFIADGNILGVIQGNSEHGSRALGNRSIICNPIAGMKDKLNKKVKNREWYRPFAPMVRSEDIQTYFNFPGTESRHMTFVAEVKDEWKEVLPAITHEDGTGRLQTLTEDQNPLIYNVISHFKRLTGHGVILNTSFNVNGKPILTRLSDAFEIIEKSKLDAVFYRGYLIFRRGDELQFKKYRKEERAKVNPNSETTVHLMLFDPNLASNIGQYQDMANKLADLKGVKVSVMADVASEEIVRRNFSCNCHFVGTNRHYYSKVIQDNYPKVVGTVALGEFIQLLWAKEAMKENPYNSRNHIFINAPKAKNLKIIGLTKSMIASINSTKFTEEFSIVSSKAPNLTGNFDAAFYKEEFRAEPTVSYYGTIIGGTDEDLDWLLTNYEGILNWYLSLGKKGTESDFLTTSMMGNQERFRPFPI